MQGVRSLQSILFALIQSQICLLSERWTSERAAWSVLPARFPVETVETYESRLRAPYDDSVPWHVLQERADVADSGFGLEGASRVGNYNLKTIVFNKLAFEKCPILSIEGGRRGTEWATENAMLETVDIGLGCFVLMRLCKIKSEKFAMKWLAENNKLRMFRYRNSVKKPKELEYDGASNAISASIEKWLSH